MPDAVRAVVFPSQDGWRFRILSKADGEILSESKGFMRREDAETEAEQIVGEDNVAFEDE